MSSKTPIYKLGSSDPVAFKTLIIQPKELEVEHLGSVKLKINFTSPNEKIVVEMTTEDGTVVDLTKLNLQAIEFKISIDDIVTEVRLTHALFPTYPEVKKDGD